MTVRAATTADHARIARICLLTGAQGDDATGRFTDDSALSDVYATPYLHGPGGFCLVWDVDGEACGYVLGTSDTAAFQRWFVAEWWPEVSRHHRPRTTDDAWLLPSAADPERMMIAQLDEFPAHLHIDLLPECQGKGVGRAMIEAACALLAERGVPGVHLGAERANAGAQAFYPRVGFVAVDGDDATVTFARRLAHGGASA